MMTTKRKTTNKLARKPSSSPIIGKDEIGVSVGQVEHFLAAIAESKTFHSAAAPRDKCLHLLQAIGLLIRFEIAKRSEPGHALGHPDRDQSQSANPA